MFRKCAALDQKKPLEINHCPFGNAPKNPESRALVIESESGPMQSLNEIISELEVGVKAGNQVEK
jgi:hypothetical protein